MLTKRDPNIFISLSIYDEAIIELISMSTITVIFLQTYLNLSQYDAAGQILVNAVINICAVSLVHANTCNLHAYITGLDWTGNWSQLSVSVPSSCMVS